MLQDGCGWMRMDARAGGCTLPGLPGLLLLFSNHTVTLGQLGSSEWGLSRRYRCRTGHALAPSSPGGI